MFYCPDYCFPAIPKLGASFDYAWPDPPEPEDEQYDYVAPLRPPKRRASGDWERSEIEYRNAYSVLVWDSSRERLSYPPLPRRRLPPKPGKPFDVVAWLSYHKCEYLIRSDKGRVNVCDALKGKRCVLVCCFLAPIWWGEAEPAWAIANTLDSLKASSHASDVEMVIVVKMRQDYVGDSSAFYHFLSGFAHALFIPFLDPLSRELICKSLGLDDATHPMCVAVDSASHKVVKFDCLDLFEEFGADAFPFTNKRLRELEREDNLFLPWTLAQCSTGGPSDCSLSLDRFLSGSPFSVLYNVYGSAQASVSDLSRKLVGLYLCYDGFVLMDRLRKVCGRCREHGLEFEVVLVYMPFGLSKHPKNFQNHVKQALIRQDISDWWIFPFVDSVSRRLHRVFQGYSLKDMLVLVGPEGEFVEPCGGDVIRYFRGQGDISRQYPFTRERIIQCELDRIRAITLEKVLVYGTRDFVLGCSSGVQRPVAELRGRRVLICFCNLRFSYEMPQLFKWYSEMRRKDGELELVFFPTEAGFSVPDEFRNSLPSEPMLCPFDPAHSKLTSMSNGGNDLIAFGSDGNVWSMNAFGALFIDGAEAYPFSVDLRKEVVNMLVAQHDFMWPFEALQYQDDIQ